MLFDTLDHAKQYETLHPRFSAAFDHLRKFVTASHSGDIAVGREDLSGDDLFVMVQKYPTDPPDKRVFETHQKYIDLQFILNGQETIYHAPATRLIPSGEYDVKKDLQLYKGLTTGDIDATALAMHAGDWVILFPQDGHKGGCNLEDKHAVIKVLYKIRV